MANYSQTSPYFKTPTINIGDRQSGRVMHKSVINTDGNISSLIKNFKTINSKSFLNDVRKMKFELYKKNQMKVIKKSLHKIL